MPRFLASIRNRVYARNGEPADPRRAMRRHEQPDKPDDERSFSELDRDRIIYSSAFRRLAGVTQVASPTELYPIHNRLTHSLKVALIGRGLAVRLQDQYGKERIDSIGGLDPTVVEAAGLAHDLGHPPFGHIAEHELNALVTHGVSISQRREADGPEATIRLCGAHDGYEGNAQSFRIVTGISARYLNNYGLNLSRATLCALLKYPWFRLHSEDSLQGRNRGKWGAYRSEFEDFRFARELDPGGSFARSLEALLMDWADDIAYAVHDLEDFYRAGLIPLDQLASRRTEYEVFVEREVKRQKDVAAPLSEREIRAALDWPLERAREFSRPFEGTQRERALLRSFTGALIYKYMGAISLQGSSWGENAVKIDERTKREVETLKRLTWHYVIESQALASQRFAQRHVIRSLFEVYASAAYSTKETEQRVLPTFFRERLPDAESDAAKLRIVADVIASMSEDQALETYNGLMGFSQGSAMMKPPQ